MKAFKLNYYNKETLLFIIYPYYGNLVYAPSRKLRSDKGAPEPTPAPAPLAEAKPEPAAAKAEDLFDGFWVLGFRV